MLTHSCVPRGLLLPTVIPIPKNKNKSLSDSDNYRGIALSSILGKQFDIILLKNNKELFNASKLQFGFKPNHSTHHCTYVLNEIVQYYANNNSNVHVMLLDCSKAFDRVNYVKLFSLLLDRGLCPLVARFFINLYTSQKVRVKWSYCLSKQDDVSNSVKQYCSLFIVMDVLLTRLTKSGIGCHIGYTFCGAIGYADDVSLLCPSLSSLRMFLNITDVFGREFNVDFNPNKNQFLVYRNNDESVHGIYHKYSFVRAQQYGNHLGNIKVLMLEPKMSHML